MNKGQITLKKRRQANRKMVWVAWVDSLIVPVGSVVRKFGFQLTLC